MTTNAHGLTEYLFPEGGVWIAPSGTIAWVTPRGCYPETVRVNGPLSDDDAHALLLATPGRRMGDPAVEREVARSVNLYGGDTFLGYEW